jgi:hypothetical protein
MSEQPNRNTLLAQALGERDLRQRQRADLVLQITSVDTILEALGDRIEQLLAEGARPPEEPAVVEAGPAPGEESLDAQPEPSEE